MAREPDVERKPALLAAILDYLLDKPLASLSFRTLAKALDVSTFTLVYHFGSRAELLSDIVWAISARELDIRSDQDSNPRSIDSYLSGLRLSFEWSTQPRNRQLQRLEFEASMMEAQDPSRHTFTRALYAHWQQLGEAALLGLGLSQADAEVESRLIVNTFFGVQYDLVVNDDAAAAGAAYDRMIENHRRRISELANPNAEAS